MDERIIDEALAWHHALESDDADWDAYTVWLEADPRHRLAFDQLSIVDDAVDRNRQALDMVLSAKHQQPASQEPRPNHSRRVLFGMTAAAGITAAIGVPMLMRSEPVTTYQTGPGESRTIALADTSSVELAASSVLTVTGEDMRSMKLERGAAYFDVRHDPTRQLVITAGRYRISDIGTKFSVKVAQDALELAVSEGHVGMTKNNAKRAIKVSAGQRLTAGATASKLSPIASGDVASWRTGRLVYAEAPLSLVAADISRYSGQRINVDPSLNDRRFSGVLTIGDGSRLLANLTSFMSVETHAEGDGVRISAAAGR